MGAFFSGLFVIKRFNLELYLYYTIILMFIPDRKILRNYAKVMVDFALGGGKGIKEKEVVYLQFDYPALSLAQAIYQRILERGAYPILKINDDSFSKIFYQIAQDHQLDFFPKKYSKSLIETIDHRLYLMADRDPLYLKKVDPKKIFRVNKANQWIKKWLFEKEDQGKLTWSLCLFGTQGMAKEAGLSLKDYWGQIVKACFLDETDPVNRWQKVFQQIKKIKEKLNQLPIDKIHLLAKNTDLWINLGKKRKFCGGDGRNIPSFEIFTSPDWRGTKGKIYFDFPLYRYGNIIKDIYLEFKEGKVIKARAGKNEIMLKQLVKQKNADKIGEFSLTDLRFSKITKFMANTLYDENFGGRHGNTHIALGSSYHDCYQGKAKQLTEKDWRRLGYNQSVEHTDIISTTNRQVEAVLKNGLKIVLYKEGKFVL